MAMRYQIGTHHGSRNRSLVAVVGHKSLDRTRSCLHGPSARAPFVPTRTPPRVITDARFVTTGTSFRGNRDAVRDNVSEFQALTLSLTP